MIKEKINCEKIKAVNRIYSYTNLLSCYYDCRRKKRKTINALKFELNFETELLKLQQELVSHTYEPGPSVCFVVTKPKLREIFAADFRDRVVHHVLVGYLEQIWEPLFIDQSYACRTGKGAHQAIKDLRKHIDLVTQSGRRPAYYLQIDIQSFFVSLRKDILFDIIAGQVKNPEVLWLAEKIIFHNPVINYRLKGQRSLFELIPDHKSLFKAPDCQGLPIGNLTSQFLANVYLDGLDHFVKHQLKAKYYLRYVDDLLLLSNNREQLIEWNEEINNYLKRELKLRLHPQKRILEDVRKGIDFLGYVVRPDYVLSRKRVVSALKNRLWRCNSDQAELSEAKIKYWQAIVNSYYGQFKHANTGSLRRNLWNDKFGKLREVIEPVDDQVSYFAVR